MNFIQYVLRRAQNFGNRFAGTFGNRYNVLYSGTIVKMNYTNFKHDPSPLILVLYSGLRYTHALNLNYLSQSEKQYIGRLIYSLKLGKQVISPQVLYMLLKRDVYYSIVRKSYRTYFSNRIIQPRMVCAGWTMMDRLNYPYNDQFIVSLNKYLSQEHQGYTQTQVAYYPQELQDRIIAARNSIPVGRGSSTIASAVSSGTQSATSAGTVTATR